MAQDPGVGTPPAPRPSVFLPDPAVHETGDTGIGSSPALRSDIFDPAGVSGPTTPVSTDSVGTASSPESAVYIGNATQSEYNAYPAMPIQIITYHGNAGGYPITNSPQGFHVLSKYFAATTADSAQSGSAGSFLVDTGTPFTQTFPVTGMEGDAVVQGSNILNNKAVGVAGSAEAQNSGTIQNAICLYASAKGARDAGSSVSVCWYGVYVEDPATGSAGTIADKVGVYSKLRMQGEQGLVLGVTQANATAATKGTSLYIAATNTTGNPAVKIVKKSGSTDDIFQLADSGANPILLVNQGGQAFLKASGTSHTAGSAVGPMIGMGNIGTAPTGTYTNGGFLYVNNGALVYKGGSGTVTTVAAA